MVVCPNGSAPQTGVPAEIVIDNAFMASLLPSGLEWLAQFLPYIPPLVFSTALFCADDPPDYPDMSLVEWAALVAGSPAQAAQESGRQVAQALYNILWYRLCECLIDATPPIGSPPTEPTDLPVLNPPDLVSRPQVEPCQTFTYTSASCGTGNLNRGGPNIAVPSPPTTLVYNLVGTQCGTVGAYIGNWIFTQVNAAGADISSVTFQMTTATQTHRLVVAAAPTVTAVRLNQNQVLGPSGQLITGSTIEVYCGGDEPGDVEPCCPPDAEQLALLNRIYQMVTLVQRQAAPFAYVYGDNHVGLVDDGELAVSGLIGVAVDVTTLPDRAGRAAGTPEQIFDVGYVSLGTADGWEHSRRIDHDGTLLLPPAAGAFTRIGYTLAPDVVVSIRELVMEP